MYFFFSIVVISEYECDLHFGIGLWFLRGRSVDDGMRYA